MNLDHLSWAIGSGVYDVPRMISDQLAIDWRGRLRWPIGVERYAKGNEP